MFDWDQHYDSEVAPRRLPADRAEERPPASAASVHMQATLPLRLWLLLPGLALGALWAAPAALWPAGDATARMPVSVAAFGAMPVADTTRREVALAVYDMAQAERFRSGLARFTSADLAAYAAATERDIAGIDTPLEAELRDALALIRDEIDRRRGAGDR